MATSDESGVTTAIATARGALKMLEATTEDTLAAVDLLHVTGADGPPRDPFDARDPDYIRATLPALRTMSEVYFRADVSGLERIPAERPGAAGRQPLRRGDDRRHVRLRPGVL